MDITKTCQKEIFSILLKIEEYEICILNRKNSKKNKAGKTILTINFIIFCTAIIILTISTFNKNAYVALTGLILLLICEILMIIAILVDISYSSKNLIFMFKKPSYLLMQNARISSNATIKFLPQLLNFSSNSLALAKKEIEYEKEHFDKRTAIISGSIEKLGLFPSILATTILLITQLSNNKIVDFFKDHTQIQFIFYSLITIVIFFQFLSIFTNFTSLKISHMLQILDFAIDLKKQQKENT